MLGEADVVVGRDPGRNGAQNLQATYKKLGIKAIFEGGEKHNAIGVSFNAYCNYHEALGKNYVRVVILQTRRLCRSLSRRVTIGTRPHQEGASRPGCVGWLTLYNVKKGPDPPIIPNPAYSSIDTTAQRENTLSRMELATIGCARIDNAYASVIT